MSSDGTPLPSFEEAAKQAYAKAKAAGAGKFEPGNKKDTERHIDAATGQAPSGQLSDQKATATPPVVRSALAFSGQAAMLTGRGLGRAAPACIGGLLYQGRSFSFAAGFRDGSRGYDNEDKGNHIRLRDPIGLHTLTVPMTGLLAWRLHKSKTMDLFKPLTEYIPELPRHFDGFTCRDILSHRIQLSDYAVFKSVGASVPQWFDPKASTSYYDRVWKPVGAAFNGASASESRSALLTHLVKNHESLPRVRRLTSLKGCMSHCAIALLALAMERAANDTFENIADANVFRIIEMPSAGFGAPKLVNRSHIFYQPGGLPAGHWTSKLVVPPEDPRNAAPQVFNSSLNLFANPEEFAKLAVVFFEAAVNATKEFTAPSNTAPYHELGIWYQPAKKLYQVKSDLWLRDGVTPFSGAAEYNLDKDVGGFAVSNCGSRRARFVNLLSSTLTERLFIKQVVDTGMDIWEEQGGSASFGQGAQDKTAKGAATQNTEAMEKLFSKARLGKVLGGHDKHTRL